VVLTFSYSHASYIFVFIESHNSKSICCRVSVTMQLKSVLAARMHAVIAFIPPSLFSFPICIPHGSLLPIYCALSNIWGVAARSSSLYRPCCFHPIIPPPSILLSLSLYDVHPPSLPSIHPSIPFPFSCSVSLYFSLSLSLSLSLSFSLFLPFLSFRWIRFRHWLLGQVRPAGTAAGKLCFLWLATTYKCTMTSE
jgi:hypothetical protein